MTQPTHSFHIPVMGTGFTIDTPLKVARYGISSVISLVDDVLIEQMRRYHCQANGEPFEPIDRQEEDARARRITAYLNLVDRLVRRQVRVLQGSSFEGESEISRYYQMLPESDLKNAYRAMQATLEPEVRRRRQDVLRTLALPGSIDVNIMTKLDCDAYSAGVKLPAPFSDAMAALRGYARSTLRSGIVFSAGINQRLYGYAAQFDDFFPHEGAEPRKKIILKVSDYRSALIQGKFLAKRGLWVSEYRIESGLNCGGHAFATEGHLLGPVLDEFSRHRSEMVVLLHQIYLKGLEGLGRPLPYAPLAVRLTVQGGIGTALENAFLLQHYDVDGTGWGTPFLLVPEATNVDPPHRTKMLEATADDVYLSDSSPLGIPFWNLRTSASEEARQRRIEAGQPGAPCPKGFAALSTEFTDIPICAGSRNYIRRKLEHLPQENLTPEQAASIKASVLAKSCLCHDLAGSATLNCDIDPAATPAICCGPNILNFRRIVSLEEMVAHVYGRLSVLATRDRPHMFIQELSLYLDHFHREIGQFGLKLSRRPLGYFQTFKENLLSGIAYYRDLAETALVEQRDRFLVDLEALREKIEQVLVPGEALVTQAACL